MSTFIESVMEAFKSLLSRGLLRVESSAHDPHAFGNAVVVLVGENLRVRVISDRGDTFAEAASRVDPQNWFPLQRVIQALGVSSPPSEGLLTLEKAADIVDRYYWELDTGLGCRLDQTRRALAELERFAIKRLVDRASD